MKNRGCMNPACNCHKKKTRFKAELFDCPECGNELQVVCIDCYSPISDSSKKYCIRCQAKHDDRKAKTKRKAGEVIGVVALAGYAIKEKGKVVWDNRAQIAAQAKRIKNSPATKEVAKQLVNVIKK